MCKPSVRQMPLASPTSIETVGSMSFRPGGVGLCRDGRGLLLVAQFGIGFAVVFENALHAKFDRYLMREAKGLASVERAINDTDGRADDDAVLRRVQKVFHRPLRSARNWNSVA
ncbi:hypothetical protein [Pseudaminobacter soli (ex Li et al. 2025)]|uniref:hypothetical protein n=1 Tax=Pseudaminobacter soli (ex Li et al. 2025) TaxID=1295366 RepID=UPI000D0F7FBE|nr:hypothetical protein [Mesorhizobium soli]